VSGHPVYDRHPGRLDAYYGAVGVGVGEGVGVGVGMGVRAGGGEGERGVESEGAVTHNSHSPNSPNSPQNSHSSPPSSPYSPLPSSWPITLLGDAAHPMSPFKVGVLPTYTCIRGLVFLLTTCIYGCNIYFYAFMVPLMLLWFILFYDICIYRHTPLRVRGPIRPY
jgi:hypothetical protein